MNNRNQLTAILLAVLLFGTGVAVGALGHRFYASNVVSAKAPDDFRQRYLTEMQTKLKLTPEQRTKLESIMDQTKAKYRALHPAMAKIKQEHIAEVRSILTPGQMPEYERIVADHEKHALEQDDRDRHRSQQP